MRSSAASAHSLRACSSASILWSSVMARPLADARQARLVLWPATTIERLTTVDFMMTPPNSFDGVAFCLWRAFRAARIADHPIQYSGVGLRQCPARIRDQLIPVFLRGS